MTRDIYTWQGGSVGIAVSDSPVLWPSIGEYPFYDRILYYVMTHDHLRNAALGHALRAVAPGRRVIDIGTGRDLNWALEAAGHGAKHVYAIEANGESHAMAARRGAASPYADIIEVVHGTSFDVRPAERAEVCVAELIGSIASSEGMLAAMTDAHARLLTHDGVVVPAACDTLAGAVSSRELFPDGPAFSRKALPYLRKIFDLYERPFDVRLSVADPGPEVLLSTAGVVERLRFDGSAPLEDTSRVSLTIERDGAVDGLLCWIGLEAGAGARRVDSLRDRTNWMPVYLPVFDSVVPVRRGDELTVEFERRTSDDGVHPDYHVRGTLVTAAGVTSGSILSGHHEPQLGTKPIYRRLLEVIP
ncbi:hypothetical protein ACFWY5_00455 [Nonomuraea sp. NPDC059007]|uniref:hypothetical protein n=1 Tax=Nonomuraea sp. NPDC059007 TaxID=3346692 RepID=UPI0036BB40C5